MTRHISGDHPIRRFFAEALHDSLVRLDIEETEVEGYLSELLVRFLHRDGIYAICDLHGHRVETVAEMVMEGDVRLNASSFDREREVHRHIGDFLLFWTGVYPEFLQRLKAPTGKDALLDPIRQGRLSYHVVSTFDHGDYAREVPVFRKLSDDFEAYSYGLSLVRESFEGFSA